MEFRILVRSVKAKNRPASVRPDSVDLYVQLDIYHDHLTAGSGAWTNQVAKAKSNVKILFDGDKEEDLYVCNPFKMIRDVVIVNVNNDDDDDHQSLEDGRSRRYFLRTGLFASMFSIPFEKSYAPLTFRTFDNVHKNMGNFRVCLLRVFSYGGEPVEVVFCIVGGKNYLKYDETPIEAYKQDLNMYMNIAESSVKLLNTWQKQGSRRREFMIILAKDHCAPIEAFDPVQFASKYQRKWHVGQMDISAIDCETVAGYFDIYGWFSSTPQMLVKMTGMDFDDHTPCFFDVNLEFSRLDTFIERAILREYYITKPLKSEVKYRKHDGTIVSEYAYRQS